MPVLLQTLRLLARIGATLAGLALFFYACGWLLRPERKIEYEHENLTPEEREEIVSARDPKLDTENPPVNWVDVDYGAGPEAPWRPKGEPEFMQELVDAGELPPVWERVGEEPLVVQGVDGIGRYGGTWLRSYTGDLGLVVRNYMGGGSLFRWSPHGYPIVPHVAKGWDHSDDYREWTVYLRKGMKWSDGHPLTADDFIYHYEVFWPFINPGGVQREMLHGGKEIQIEKIDDYTLRFVSEVPCPLFLERMTRVSIPCTPKHYYEQYIPGPGQTEEDLPRLQEGLKGTTLASARFLVDLLLGFNNPEHPRLWPWIFRTYQETGTLVMVRNPFYFAVDPEGNQLPYIHEVVYQQQDPKMIPATAIGGGLSFQFRHLAFSDYTLLMSNRELASNPYRVLHWYPAERSDFALFPNLNRQPNPLDAGSEAKAKLLQDKRFRQALSIAINREAIISAYYQGVGKPSQIAPGAYSDYDYPPLSNAFIEFDPARANALLDEIGLTQRDSDGFRTLPDGSFLALYVHFRRQFNGGPLPLIIDDWAQVGLRAIPRERDDNLFRHELTAGYPDITISSSSGEFSPLINPNFLLPYSQFSPAFVRYGGWYSAGGPYGNPAATSRDYYTAPPEGSPFLRAMELLEKARQEIDPERRIEITRKLLQIDAEELWSINICTPPPIPVVVDKQMRNVPEVAVQSYIFSTPNNAAKETFYFDSETYASGQPRDSESKIKSLAYQMVHVEPRPDLTGASTKDEFPEASAGKSRLGSFVRTLFILIALLAVVLLAFRHPFIGRRLLIMGPTLIIISVIVFTIIQAPPGDFIETYVARLEAEGQSELSRVEDLRKMFWLDDPMYVRYARWLGLKWFITFDPIDTGLIQGNLGRSMDTQRAVNAIIEDRILLTVLISAGTILFTWIVALPIGIYSAVRQYSPADYVFTLVGFFGMCIPGFLLALLLSYFGRAFFGIEMTGLFSPEFVASEWNLARFIDLLKHIWVPIVVMGVSGTSGMIRVMRGNLLDELKKPYVTTARAKGVRPMKLLLKYPVRLALNPFISNIGALFPQLISGGAIVAIVLSLPTIGPKLLESLMNEDMYFAGSLLMILSALSVFGMLVSDLLLLMLDPRIRMEGRGSK